LAVVRHYLPTLDGWRAVAIVAVLCCHAGWPTPTLAPYGAMGVSLFFAISGFLITRRLTDEKRIDLAAFFRRRAFRILPPIVVYLVVLAVLGLWLRVIPVDSAQLLASLFFFRNYHTALAGHGWYTGHFWSLAVEEHFYLFWPVLLSIAGFRRARWLAPLFALAIAGWRALDLHYGWVAHWNPALAGSLGRTDYRLDSLLLGCAMALIWHHARVQALLERISGTALAIAAAVAAVCCQIWTPPAYLTIVAALMVVIPASTVAQPRCWLGRILEWRPLAWIGRLSYSLYIWQQLFLAPSPAGLWQRAPWNLAAAFACAAASYYLIERPAIAFGRSLAQGPLGPRSSPMTAPRAAVNRELRADG
jgi:peptidoglycan/LPS O-acetylase OafA/YrhL